MRILSVTLAGVLVAALGGLGGCFSPAVADCQFTCTADDSCPDGTSCTGGFCRVPGAAAGDVCTMSMGQTLTLVPAALTVPIGRAQIFAATDAVGPVTWSVMESGGGSIDATGRYTAPATPGTYHVVATTSAGSGSATVTVADLQLAILAGSLGGSGSVDATSTQARFDQPYAVAADGSGDVYVADADNFVIRKIVVATGVVTTIAGQASVSGTSDGIGPAAHFLAPVGLAIDPAGGTAGILYVVDITDDTIRRIDLASRMVTTLAGSHGEAGAADGVGSAASFMAPVNAAFCGGALYVADEGNAEIRKVVVATATVSTQAAGGTVGAPFAIACDATNLYFTTVDAGDNKIKLAPLSGSTATVISGTGVAGNMEGTATAATFNSPEGLALDAPNMRLLVADTGNNRIRSVDLTNGTTTAVAGGGFGACGATDGASATFCVPIGLSLDGSHIYVADSTNATIRAITVGNGVVATVAGLAPHAGDTNGDGASAMFDRPYGLVADGSGNVYVDDRKTVRALVLSPSPSVSALAGNSSATSAGSDGTGAVAVFASPLGLALDGSGDVWVGDAGAVRDVTIDGGDVSTPFGSLTVRGNVDEPGTMARFAGVAAEVVVGDKMYVADAANNTIRELDLASDVVATLAGSPTAENGTSDGVGSAALFDTPTAIASDGAGNLFVADTGNGTIREIAISTGAVTTIAGSARSYGTADGIGAAARFTSPKGLVWDGAGSLYVVDAAARSIRRLIVATGAVSTFAGQSTSGAGVLLGSVASARFNTPESIAITPSGELLITDAAENTVLSLAAD